MPRQATQSRLRDDPGSPHEAAESENDIPQDFDEDVTPSAAGEALEAAFPEVEELPQPETPKPKQGGGVLQLILIAIFGVAAGFTAVMLI